MVPPARQVQKEVGRLRKRKDLPFLQTFAPILEAKKQEKIAFSLVAPTEGLLTLPQKSWRSLKLKEGHTVRDRRQRCGMGEQVKQEPEKMQKGSSYALYPPVGYNLSTSIHHLLTNYLLYWYTKHACRICSLDRIYSVCIIICKCHIWTLVHLPILFRTLQYMYNNCTFYF